MTVDIAQLKYSNNKYYTLTFRYIYIDGRGIKIHNHKFLDAPYPSNWIS